MLMETFMTVFGKMIKQMVKVCTSTLTGLSTKDNGKMISKMERVLKHGLMERVMRVAT
jgi:hypothetical protein